jgi:hypothetical protein
MLRTFLTGLLMITALFLTGCETVSKAPLVIEMSQIETRQLQSRTYDSSDTIEAIKSVIAALQDEGYLIDNANETLGVVTASREDGTEIDGAKVYAEGYTYNGSYETVQRTIVSASISQVAGKLKIRINIVRKAFNQNAGVIWSVPIQDAAQYQRLFSKVDKSLFLNREEI